MSNKGKTGVDVQRLLRVSAHQLWLATLVGDPPPSLSRLHARIASVSPGNLVAEISTAYQREHDECAVGRLVARRREALRFELEDEAVDFLQRSEVAWYLELLDGRLFRWHNASFVRVLEDARGDENDEADRGWVAGALARHDIDSLAAQQPWLKVPIETGEAVGSGDQ